MSTSFSAPHPSAVDKCAVLSEAQASSPEAASRLAAMLEAVEEARRVYRQAVSDDHDLEMLITLARADGMNTRGQEEHVNWLDFIGSLERRQRNRRDAAEVKLVRLIRSFADPFAIRRLIEADR